MQSPSDPSELVALPLNPPLDAEQRMQIDLQLGALEAQGIPVVKRRTHPGFRGAGPVANVPREHYKHAVRLLSQLPLPHSESTPPHHARKMRPAQYLFWALAALFLLSLLYTTFGNFFRALRYR